MNSQQRRKDRREWRYHVDLGIRTFNEYVDMWRWLDQRHGRRILRCGWRDRIEEVDGDDDRYHVVWQFLRERDAAEFALRWA